MRTIVLVEDNSDWSEDAANALQIAFPDATIIRVYSEHEFVSMLPDFRRAPPTIFVVDIMLPWCEPSNDMPEAPEDVKGNGFWRAGARCRHRLTEVPELAAVPVVFWSIISRSDLELLYKDQHLPSATYHVSKDLGLGELVGRIRQLVQNSRQISS